MLRVVLYIYVIHRAQEYGSKKEDFCTVSSHIQDSTIPVHSAKWYQKRSKRPELDVQGHLIMYGIHFLVLSRPRVFSIL